MTDSQNLTLEVESLGAEEAFKAYVNKQGGWKRLSAHLSTKQAADFKLNWIEGYTFAQAEKVKIVGELVLPKVLPCSIKFEPGPRFGKGVSTETALKFLGRYEESITRVKSLVKDEDSFKQLMDIISTIRDENVPENQKASKLDDTYHGSQVHRKIQANSLAVNEILYPERYAEFKVACWSMVEKLREVEGNAVNIFCDNPDSETKEMQCAVECLANFTGYKEHRFYGKNIKEALESAISAHDAYKEENS